jgi:hypothetical protein
MDATDNRARHIANASSPFTIADPSSETKQNKINQKNGHLPDAIRLPNEEIVHVVLAGRPIVPAHGRDTRGPSSINERNGSYSAHAAFPHRGRRIVLMPACACIRVCVHALMCAHACMHVCACALCACVRAVHACMHVCACALCVCVRTVHACACMCARAHACVRTHAVRA